MVADEIFDIPTIFNIDIEEQDSSKWNVLTTGLKNLEVKPLNLYEEDLTDSMKKKMMEKLASEALD